MGFFRFLSLKTLLWLAAVALLAFAYALSTLFSTSRVAGLAAVMLHALAMFPRRAAARVAYMPLRKLCASRCLQAAASVHPI